MLYREIIAVCSQIHTKHTNTLCGQNVELLNVKPRSIQTKIDSVIPFSTQLYNILDLLKRIEVKGHFFSLCSRN